MPAFSSSRGEKKGEQPGGKEGGRGVGPEGKRKRTYPYIILPSLGGGGKKKDRHRTMEEKREGDDGRSCT